MTVPGQGRGAMVAREAYEQAALLLARGLERRAIHGLPWATYYPVALAADCAAWSKAVCVGGNAFEITLLGNEFLVDSKTWCAVASLCNCWDCTFSDRYRAHRVEQIESHLLYVLSKL